MTGSDKQLLAVAYGEQRSLRWECSLRQPSWLTMYLVLLVHIVGATVGIGIAWMDDPLQIAAVVVYVWTIWSISFVALYLLCARINESNAPDDDPEAC